MWVVSLCGYVYGNDFPKDVFFFFKYGLLKFAPPWIWCFLVGRDVCRSFFFLNLGSSTLSGLPLKKAWQKSMRSLLGVGWRTMNLAQFVPFKRSPISQIKIYKNIHKSNRQIPESLQIFDLVHLGLNDPTIQLRRDLSMTRGLMAARVACGRYPWTCRSLTNFG